MSPPGSPGKGPASSSQPKSPPPPFYVPINSVFYLCLLSNTLAASLAPIQDCDEVYNYWEPTHYMTHGHGLQTWEYSPEYSIRSWLYITIHAGIAKTLGFFVRTKSAQFYMVRLALGFFCTVCETRLFAAISRSLNPKIGLFFLVIMVFSPGMFHASAAVLPSSFSMYMSMLGLAAFLNLQGGWKTVEGIIWFGVGAMVGWPFAGALVIPFLLEEAAVAWSLGDVVSMFKRVFEGVMKCLLILSAVVLVDSLFYRKLTLVPWNIVAYNVFGGADKGPNIFGTEPWTFYFKNLLLNFNIWVALALASGPLLVLQALFCPHKSSAQTLFRTITLVLPFYMWFTVFTLQPHKEERFMYPAYPFLALNAAIAFHIILAYIGTSDPKTLVGSIPTKVKLIFAVVPVLLAVNIGLFRIAGVVTAYNAPLQILDPLQQPNSVHLEGFVCYGKEWYRFPSSFFLPNNNFRAKFIKSEFRGLLPGEFAESGTELGYFPGTWTIPKGMNDRNQEDPGKYTDISQCTYLVDSYFPGDDETKLEPHYVLDTATWEKLSCKPFLDSRRTGILGRMIWIPNLPFIPKKYRLLTGRASPVAEATSLRQGKRLDRKPGEWIPSDFKRLDPAPYPDWDVHSFKPKPYRPFRYGPKYHITMGLRAMKWDEWIELDNQYLGFHADKARRIEERADKCCLTTPESMDGVIELLEELCTYLPQRYPSLFRKTSVGIDNLLTHESFNIISRPWAENPIITCSRLIQDDIALMYERADGQYYLLAGSILLAGFWRLKDKFQMPLSQIHTSGSVPGYKSHLERGMMNFFRRLKPADPVLRNNYFIQVDDELAWSGSIGSEDGETVSWNTAERNKVVESHYFRSERQSLRRLPRTGAVVFTIRTYFEPITEIVKEAYVPGRLAAAIRSWGDDVARYKGREKYGEVLLEYLDRKHEEQVANGLDLGLEDEVRSYPY
ncbi:uncharacterized protein GIQ15_01802 [Arthroderma uncinatum]|uniref:uncharacterized protein n=1 Tax=Arthroderma uncinatum TaxID=74035 RepID=UPI00144A954E|nr:uncharacterized protein GIQ15_01802 [Arthroderma uncinatum]KAF3492285.1 hypothetical protein GIQ15_01802 [Arthroderma uncinatum]